MSVQAITWALSVRAGSPGAKAVLLALANYANEFGMCWPSQKRLAEETDQSVDTVQRRLKDLESIPLISREDRGLRNGRHALTVYTCLMAGGAAAHAAAPQFAAPQSAAPQIEPNDTALLRQEPLREPLDSAAANARAREPSKSLISAEAYRLCDDLLRLQRLDLDDPRAIGTPYQVQTWLTKGWRAELIAHAVEAVMAKRSAPPKSLRYFEPAIAEVHAEHDRPLPVAAPSHDRPRRANGARGAGSVSDVLRSLTNH